MPNQVKCGINIDQAKWDYQSVTRIVLNHMDDRYMDGKFAVPSGTGVTVKFVDDAEQIHPIWDNGRTLTVIPEIDSFRKLTEQELREEQRLTQQNQGEQQWQTPLL